MAERIKTNKVNIQSTTKDGECKINICLDLNININSGEVVVNAQNITPLKKQEEKKKEDVYMIPDFGSSQIIDFGK
jgi:hypothetical protein